jgi:hypothetical protein
MKGDFVSTLGLTMRIVIHHQRGMLNLFSAYSLVAVCKMCVWVRYVGVKRSEEGFCTRSGSLMGEAYDMS